MVDGNLRNRLVFGLAGGGRCRRHILVEMKPGRCFLLLASIALFGASASFDAVMAEGREEGGVPSQQVGARFNAELPANPLWGLPLARFSITQERPIFLPSRRPPRPPPTYAAPVAVRQPAKPPEPERPAVSLIGTVIGTDVQIGVFLEQATNKVVRLRLGEEHQGWVLRLVKEREVTLVKDVEQILVLGPTLGDATLARATIAPQPVPNSIGTVPVVNTADYVDEQPLPKRGPQRQRN
jgi:general secretion pathway protein N